VLGIIWKSSPLSNHEKVHFCWCRNTFCDDLV
jgi:hypothetical protein